MSTVCTVSVPRSGFTSVNDNSEITFSYLSADILFVPEERVWHPRGFSTGWQRKGRREEILLGSTIKRIPSQLWLLEDLFTPERPTYGPAALPGDQGWRGREEGRDFSGALWAPCPQENCPGLREFPALGHTHP